jgi:membrane protein DedA with SNARE-associated domain
MLDYILSLIDQVGPWGFVIIFVIVILECQPGLGFFMPGESLVVTAGFFASLGHFDVVALIAGVAAGAIIGDTIAFELGEKLGRGWLLRHGGWCGIREPQLARVDSYFIRHGGKSVFLGHFMHVFRALMPFLAGASKMPYRRFVLYNTPGCILWATIFTLLGYFFGESLPLLERWIGRTGLIIGGAIVLTLILVWFFRWRPRGVR